VTTKRASVRSAGWISLCSLAQLIVQFLFQVLLANYFGAGADMDAYLAAILPPTVLSGILAGPLSYALIPVFSEPLQRGDNVEAWRSASRLGTWLVTLAVPACALISVAAGPLTRVLEPGFSGRHFTLYVELLRIFSWLLLTNLVLAYLQALYHCCQRFLLPAISPIVSTLATLVIALSLESPDIHEMALAVLAGSVLGVALHLPIVLQRLRPNWGMDDKLKHAARLIVPLVAGAVYYRVDPLVDAHLASTLEPGSLTHVGLAWRLASALVVVGTSGLSIVVFPSLAALWQQREGDTCRAEAAFSMRCLCTILVPIVAAVGFYAGPLIADLYERGAFLPADSRAVSQLLVLYLGMVVAAGFGEVTAKVFFAIGDTRTPVLVGVSGFTIGVLLKFGLTPVLGAMGIVLATSVYRLLNISAMSVLLFRRLGGEVYAGIGRALLRAAAAALLAVAVAFPFVRSGLPFSTFWGAGAGLVGYVVMLWLLGDELLNTVWRRWRGAEQRPSDQSESGTPTAVSHQEGASEL